MPHDKKLFSEFPPVTPEQWIRQIVTDLKGADFHEKLRYTTPDGISVGPFYTEEDLPAGVSQEPLFTHTDWVICETIDAAQPAEANRKALHALNNGASGLIFDIPPGTDLDILLRDILPEHIDLQFRPSGDPAAFVRALTAWSGSHPDARSLRIGIHADYLAQALISGSWQQDAAAWSDLFTATAPYRICLDATIYQNAGAPPAYQLACTLAHLHSLMTLPGLVPGDVAKRIQINTSTGPDYFFEIAKLRALRKLFALLTDSYGVQVPLLIHAETSQRNLTVYDAYNNLLRTTTEAMAAVTGGCNSLAVTPFDAAIRPSGDFSERMARNIQLILKSESYFDQVSDVSAGSYFIETLTNQLAEKAWDTFRDIEARGGFVACIRDGSIQEQIRSYSTQEDERFAAGTEVLVGVNRFPDKQEKRTEPLTASPRYPAPSADPEITPLRLYRLAAVQENARSRDEN